MIEIGKKFFWGYHTAHQAAGTAQQKSRLLASQAEEQARALEQNYRAKTAYLFRSATENMRQTTQAALAALAQEQARRVANGASSVSASAVDEAQQARLRTQLQNRAVQADLQAQGAQTQRTFAQKYKALWQTVHTARKAAKRGDRFSSLGRALLSLFH